VNLKEEDSSEILTTRRGLFKGLFAFLGALGLGSMLYGLYGFLARGEGSTSPVEIPLNKILLGSAYPFQFGGSPAILIHEEEGAIVAFSLVCTHLGCTVVWNPEKKEFHCPCHDGLFDAQGNVLSGPPSSPLERWKVTVNGEKVLIG
jgi:cytochrome b6-f complex iron-sulfur subunit